MGVLRWLLGDDADLLADRQFQVILLANTMAPLGTALLSPVLDSLIDPFGASAASIGLMTSMVTAPAIVLPPVAGVLADRIGRRPVLIGGLLCFGVGGTAIALTTDFRVVLALRLLQGIGWAGVIPVIITAIGDIYTGDRETTAQGLRFTSSGIVQTIGPVIAGLVVVIAWQYPFLIYGLTFPVVLAVWAWFEEPVDPDAEPDSDTRGVRTQIRELWSLIAQPKPAAMLLARAAPGIVWLGFLTYNSILVRNVLGGTPADAGLLAALGSLGYAASATQAGRITAIFERRLVPLLMLNLALAGGMAMAFLAPGVAIAGIGVGLSGLGLGALMSIYRSIITGLAPIVLRGGLVSLGEGLGRFAVTVTPVAMGAGIAIGTPMVGFVPAIRLVGVGTAVIAGFISIGAVIVASLAPAVRDPTA
ncbi:MAG: MFS transporter [Salinirussus sp.]